MRITKNKKPRQRQDRPPQENRGKDRPSARHRDAQSHELRRQGGRQRDGNRSKGHKGDATQVQLYGIHAVEAALGNPRRALHRLRLTDNAAQKLKPPIEARNLRPERVTAKDLDHILGPDQVHQGVLLDCAPLLEPSLQDLAAQTAAHRPLLVLDQVTDPHNVGAIIRSAAFFGAAGLVMTRRHSPPLAGTLAKSASGGLEHVAVTLVPNLARAMGQLKDLGLSCIGLDGDAEALLPPLALDSPVALVLGAEGHGLRRLTRANCDHLCRIGANGPINSLNVSNAAAVALSWLTARTGSGPLPAPPHGRR